MQLLFQREHNAQMDRAALEKLEFFGCIDFFLSETARHADWHNPGKGRWRIAPGSDAEATTLVFDRGQREAWRVSFESHDGAWRITGLQATTRTIE